MARIPAILLAATLAAAATAGTVYERQVDPLTPAFARTTIQWTGKLKGETMIVYGVEEHAGRIAVCGLHMSSGSYSREALMNGLRRSSITSGGKILITDLRYFDEFKGPRDLFRFFCKVTALRWDPAFAARKPRYVQGTDFRDPALN